MKATTYAIREVSGYTGATKDYSGTLDELTRQFSFVLEMGKRCDGEIDAEPKTARSLAENLSKAAAVRMENKRYELLGETQRVPYWDWKNCFPECETVKGSYDAKRRTIEFVVPDGIMESREKFSRREWEKNYNRGYDDGWRLKGTGIVVVWGGSGVCAYYSVRATPPDTDKVYYKDPLTGTRYMNDLKLYVTIGIGYGPAARDKAIQKARELAATGEYALA